MELLLLAFLILLNGLFAMSEMAIVSSRKARLQQWALENRPGATAALALANDPSRFLATESLTAMEVVALFRKHRRTAGLVVDEHGELQGLVTINDVVKALAGDIATVEETAERDVVRREEGSWLIDGAVTVQRFKEAIGVRIDLPEEELGTYHTLGGFAMMQLGRVPGVGDAFTWQAHRIEVVDMDGNRVDKLLVTRLPAARK